MDPLLPMRPSGVRIAPTHRRVLTGVTLAVVVAIAVLYLVPALLPLRAVFAETYSTWMLRTLAVLALAPGIGRLRSPAERRYWTLTIAAFGTWFVSDLVFPPSDEPSMVFAIIEDAGFLAFWTLMLLAAGQGPERHLRTLSWHGTRWVPTAAALLTATLFYAYMILPPMFRDTTAFLAAVPSYAAFVLLDLLVAGVLTVRAISTPGRWRVLHGLMALALTIWATTDTLDGLYRAEAFSWEFGTPLDLLWYAPYLLIVWAALVRDATAPQVSGGTILEPEEEGSHLGWVVCLALTLPILHGLHRTTDWLPFYRTWHVALVLVGIGLFAGLALLARLRASRTEADEVHILILDDTLQQTQKMEALGRLSGGIAHDFNNLLLIVQANVELMADRIEALPEGVEFVQGLRRAVERGSGLTRQLLAFGRQPGAQTHSTDINAIIGETRSLLERCLGEHIQLRTELADELWPTGVEPGQLSQILINLALNASNAMDAGGRLTIRTSNLRVGDVASSRPAAAFVRIEVSDTGHGMDEATRERIFEPFFTTRHDHGGTGLGLSVVYGIVRQHGGDIQCHSATGLGTTFRILLPRADAVAPPAPISIPAVGDSAVAGTVLLVEDQADVRSITERYLRGQGYQVLTASDGVEAWERAAATDAIDVVLTDVAMPRMGGVELARRLRGAWPSIPIVFVTGHAQDPTAVADLRTFGAEVLQKPYSLTELGDAVRRSLVQSTKRSAPGA